MIPCAIGALLLGIAIALLLKTLPAPAPQGLPSEEDARAPRPSDPEHPVRRALLDGFAGSLQAKEAFFKRYGLDRPKLIRATDTLQIFSASYHGKLFRMPVLVGFYRQRVAVSADLLQLFWEEVEGNPTLVAGIVICLGSLEPEARELVRVRRLFAVEGRRLARLLATEPELRAVLGGQAEPGKPPVRAAGVIVLRRGPSGADETLLLHNPRHDTWGFPKGHLDPGEDELSGALRELQEEVGWAPTDVVEGFRHESSYTLPETMGSAAGRTKTVTYFLAYAPPFLEVQLSEEHAEFAWETYEKAKERVRFPSTCEVVEAVEAFVHPSA